jgi:putative membrane protein
VAAVIISFGSQLFLQESVDGEAYILDWFSQLSGLTMILLVFVVLYAIGLVVSVAMTTLKYFGFTLTNREDSLYVEYGLLTRRTHTLMKKQIGGAAYKQPFFMGLAKAGVLEVYVAGYSLEESNAPKDPTLFPLVREKELAEFLRLHVPTVSLPESYERPAARALPYFFLCPRFVLSLLLFLATLGPVALPGFFRGLTLPFIDWLWVPGLVLLALVVASVLLEKSRTGIDSRQEQVSLSLGGFTRRQVFLLPEKIESIRENGSLRKKDKNITNVLVHILAAAAYSGHRVRNVSLDAFHRAAACLKY